MSQSTTPSSPRRPPRPAVSPFLNPNSQTLDPKNDVTFKLLFAAEPNRSLLVKLLSAVLAPPSPIAHADVLNPEVDRHAWDDKGAVLDIRVRFCDGTQADVEMQSRSHQALEERLVFYWAKLYAGQLGTGERHSLLKPVVGVYFLDFIRLPTTRFHSRFHIREDHEGFPLTDALEMHFLELPKLPECAMPPHGDPSASLLHWCLFLAAQSDADLEALAMTDPDILLAKDALDALSTDPKARELAEARALWHYVLRQEKDHQFSEGEAKGLRDGEAKGLRDGEAKGLRDGLRQAVATACELLEIELPAARCQALEALPVTDLELLLSAIKRDRCWPA